MDTLLQVVALDDVVSLLAYSAAIAFALHSLTGRSSDPVGDLLVPIGTTLGADTGRCMRTAAQMAAPRHPHH